MPALVSGALRLVNHVVKGEPWALERLRVHRGAVLCIQARQYSASVVIDSEGLFQAAGTQTHDPDVTVTLPEDLITRLIGDRASVLAALHIAGSADIAESLAFVFRNLRWDIESDLAMFLGDIAAHRVGRIARMLGNGFGEAVQRLNQNLGEYLLDESRVLIAGDEWTRLTADIGDMQRQISLLEHRVDRL